MKTGIIYMQWKIHYLLSFTKTVIFFVSYG